MTYIPPRAAQHPWELQKLCELVSATGVKRYLEVGVRRGGTFYAVAKSMPVGSTVVALDLPQACWGQDSADDLNGVIAQLCSEGYDAHVFYGDSQTQLMADSIASRFEAFDMILIDADHTYQGVKRDWELYGPMGKYIVFHDIIGDGCRDRVTDLPVEVPVLWRELRKTHHHFEYVGKDSIMGIGVLWK